MFNQDELDFIELGKLSVMKSLKEMQKDGDDLNYINYEGLIEKILRNITNKALIDAVEEVDDLTDKQKKLFGGDDFEWKEEMK